MKRLLISICALFVFGIAHAAQCPAGTYGTGDDGAECTPCPIGTYSNSGATECTPCPDGYPNTADTGTDSRDKCYSNVKERPWTGGQICRAPGCINTICEPCEIKPCEYVAYSPLWAFMPGDGNVISGCETNDANCETPIQSVVTMPGYGVVDMQRCEKCPAGTYSTGGKNAVCTPCPDNIHVSPIGSTDITDCGRVLNYQKPGDNAPTQIFLNGIRNTSPSFNVKIGNDVLYANMTAVNDTTASGMYVNYNDQSYIITSSERSKPTVDTFTITTIDTTTNFKIQISAIGDFRIDWGDGTVDDIVRDNTTLETYQHKYNTAGAYDIMLSGSATKYSTDNAAINFDIPEQFSFMTRTAINIARISGSLGIIFPTIGNGGVGNQPLFTGTFSGATNLTGEIPAELFNGINGAPAPQMFVNTFRGCSGLTGLSARVAGVPLYEWAATVENACPDGQFSFMPKTCGTYTSATGLLDYDEIPSEWK